MTSRSRPTPRDHCAADPCDAPAPVPAPVLGPATRLLWRSPGEVHLELGPHAVVVDGLAPELVRRVAGRHAADDRRPQGGTPADVVAADGVAADGVAADGMVRLALDTLEESGFLWPRAGSDDDPRLRPPAPRLSGELAALAVEHGPGAADVLQARHDAAVEVHGAGRVAVQLAAVLAAAGVGRVRCVGAGDVRLVHAAPGGLLPGDEGRLRVAAADDALLRAAPDVDTTPLPTDRRPDLAVLALDAPLPDERREALHADGTPHLSVVLGVDHGVVGPLVLPGLTSCLRCADLLRTDRDPAWRALSLQLATPQRYGALSAVAVATVVAGVAAVQVLTFLDGGDPASVDGTLEVRLPDWRVRRRSWSIHPDCDCTSPAGASRVTAPADTPAPRR